jgi:hypothetical protein
MSEKEGGVRKRTLNKSGMRNVHSQGKTGNYSGKVGNGHVFPDGLAMHRRSEGLVNVLEADEKYT